MFTPLLYKYAGTESCIYGQPDPGNRGSVTHYQGTITAPEGIISRLVKSSHVVYFASQTKYLQTNLATNKIGLVFILYMTNLKIYDSLQAKMTATPRGCCTIFLSRASHAGHMVSGIKRRGFGHLRKYV